MISHPNGSCEVTLTEQVFAIEHMFASEKKIEKGVDKKKYDKGLTFRRSRAAPVQPRSRSKSRDSSGVIRQTFDTSSRSDPCI